MPELRPLQYLHHVSREYGRDMLDPYHELVDQERRRLAWAPGCFAPLELTKTYVNAACGVPAETRPQQLALLYRAALLHAASAWRLTQGVYRFADELLDELWTTPVTGKLPVEHLQRLPEWCVYVETKRDWFGKYLHGFFATMCDEGEPFLSLIFDIGKADDRTALGFAGTFLRLRGTFEESIAATVSGTHEAVPQRTAAEDEALQDELATWLPPLLSLLLYLCATEPEFRDSRMFRDRPHRPERVRNRQGKPIYLPPKRPTVWETGYRIGAALRDAQNAPGAGRNASPSGHVRRAHWHSYWVGPRNEPSRRELKLRWLSPILVNLPVSDELVPTIRNVDARS